MLLLLFFVVITLCVIHFYIFESEYARKLRKIPGPKAIPVIGNMSYLLLDPISYFYQERKLASQFQNKQKVCRLMILKIAAVAIYDPDDIELLLSNPKHITKGIVYDYLHPWLNFGLLTSSGEKWQSRRKILTPAFHFNILQQFCKIFKEQSKKLVENLKSEVEEPETNIFPFITNFALHTISETAMGFNLDSNHDTGDEYKKGIYKMGELIMDRASKPWLQFDLIYEKTSGGKERKKLLEVLHNFTTNVIRKRRLTWNDSNNKLQMEDMDSESIGIKKRMAMLDLLLMAESEGKIDEFGIREEVDTFMFEGHDTTTVAITFSLMLIANHPEIQIKIITELNDIFGNEERPITMEDLNKMSYLEMCLKEALRLYPSVPFIGRILKEDLKLKNYTIPAGTNCDVHIFDIHRNPVLYPDPERFDPERFSPENARSRHPYAYIPFSAGPRNCIGQRFALLEEKTVISMILRNYKLLPVTKPEDIIFAADLVLRCRDPVKIKLIPRK